MVGWFALIILPHLLLTLAGRRKVVPPLFLAGLGLIAGLRVRRAGSPVPGRLLLVANHVSWLDILALAASARAAFVAHGGLAGHTILKWLCVQNDTLFIARERRGTVGEQVQRIRGALDKRRLAVFPEGTTGDGRSTGPFKSALFAAVEDSAGSGEVAIQPVMLGYRAPREIAWVGAKSGLENALRILARTRPVHLDVHFLEPLAGVSLAGRKAMALAAAEAIEAALRLQNSARMR